MNNEVKFTNPADAITDEMKGFRYLHYSAMVGDSPAIIYGMGMHDANVGLPPLYHGIIPFEANKSGNLEFQKIPVDELSPMLDDATAANLRVVQAGVYNEHKNLCDMRNGLNQNAANGEGGYLLIAQIRHIYGENMYAFDYRLMLDDDLPPAVMTLVVKFDVFNTSIQRLSELLLLGTKWIGETSDWHTKVTDPAKRNRYIDDIVDMTEGSIAFQMLCLASNFFSDFRSMETVTERVMFSS